MAWVSHQWPSPDDTPARPHLNPGRWAGGAEMLQELMRSKVPAGVELVLVNARDPMDVLDGCDKVVVAGLDFLTTVGRMRIAAHAPFVWLMTPVQPQSLGLLRRSTLIWASDLLARRTGFSPDFVCCGWWDTGQVPAPRTRQYDALWAHRDTPLKGEDAAVEWARDNGRVLTILKNRPRAEVLEAMAGADTFVHLPHDLDSCPTAVIEAEIAGCTIVANDRVGRTPVRGRQANIEYIEGNAARFWGLVLR